MGLFSKKIGPVFLNETCKTQDIIDKLLELQKRAEGEAAKKLKRRSILRNMVNWERRT